ncbi:uncharacterized protein LOC136082762 [Hydra vulgaris]|uniref:Uncharacterized protein LOC136082762 n=1 Tax=Hydra vulgaris TaxID=6087 RepID=A0ABM4C9B8_HYDVU
MGVNHPTGIEQIGVNGEALEPSLFECPLQDKTGAFMFRFHETGTYNFRSIDFSHHLMTVVVELKEEVIKVQVSPKSVRPDPAVARAGDIICWMWPKGVSSSITYFKPGDKEADEVLFTESAMRGTGHGYRYLDLRDGKIDNSYKMEILNSEKLNSKKN